MKPANSALTVSGIRASIGTNPEAWTITWWEKADSESVSTSFTSGSPTPFGVSISGIHPKCCWITNRRLMVRVYQDSNSYTTTLETTGLRGDVGIWYHYALALSAASHEVKLYRDAALLHSGTLLGSETTTFNTGVEPPNIGWALPGDVQDLRFYTRILDASEVSRICLSRGQDHVRQSLVWRAVLLHPIGMVWDTTHCSRPIYDRQFLDSRIYTYLGPPTQPSNIATESGYICPTPRRPRRIG